MTVLTWNLPTSTSCTKGGMAPASPIWSCSSLLLARAPKQPAAIKQLLSNLGDAHSAVIPSTIKGTQRRILLG